MIFKITTTGKLYRNKEDIEKLMSIGFTFESSLIDEKEYLRKKEESLEVEIKTLEELLEFGRVQGEIIILHGSDKPEIEIYNDYRES